MDFIVKKIIQKKLYGKNRVHCSIRGLRRTSKLQNDFNMN